MRDPELVLDTDISTVSSNTPLEIYDVVIVGAGPIGLATALGLRQRGIENILVIDQTRAFRQVGQVIDLLPNGLKSLKYLHTHAYEKIKHNQSSNQQSIETKPKSPAAWIYKNFQGQVIRSVPLGYEEWFKNYGEGRISTSWYNLQTTFRELLPPDQVKANHRCINVVEEPENNCVRLDCVSNLGAETNPYAYWENGQENDHNQIPTSEVTSQQTVTKSIRSQLIVAADGINSTIRQVLYQDTPYHNFAKPEYSGFAGILCLEITEIPEQLQTELTENFFQDTKVVTISNDTTSRDTTAEEPRIILFYRANGQIGYLLHAPLSLELLQEKSGSALIDLAVQTLATAGFPNVIQKLVSISPPDQIQQRPYYLHRAIVEPGKILPTWSTSRVVLVGDAAHGMPPFMAQGANQGLEDALVITSLIANIAQKNQWNNISSIVAAFDKYESIRRPIMEYVQDVTLKQFSQSSTQEWESYGQKVYGRDFDQIIEVE